MNIRILETEEMKKKEKRMIERGGMKNKDKSPPIRSPELNSSAHLCIIERCSAVEEQVSYQISRAEQQCPPLHNREMFSSRGAGLQSDL